MAKVSADELSVWSRYIETLCGIKLDASKGYLIETRLIDLLRTHKCATFSELYHKVKSDRTGELDRAVIDRITTNETSFFRDNAPFDMLRNKILPELIDRRERVFGRGKAPLKIWSAACSNGQEVYTIAIILKELLGDPHRYNIRLIGTDISNNAIGTASRGIYNGVEIQRGLPAGYQQRYFNQTAQGWKIDDSLRGLATFRQLNLMENFAFMGAFDVIFCRNVAIYFSEEKRRDLFNRLAQQLAPDGYLVIGSTESITGLCPQFTAHRHLRSVYYCKEQGV